MAFHASGNKPKSFDPSGTQIASVASRVDVPIDTVVTLRILIHRAADVAFPRGSFPLIYVVAPIFQTFKLYTDPDI